MRLQWLDPREPQQEFPPVTHALRNPNGLLAAGGDLTVTRLLQAYRHGIFPWFNPDEPIMWWAPYPRAVFIPDQIRISRSLHKSLGKSDYAVTLDHAFTRVIKSCSEQRAQGTWLGPAMQAAYTELHRRGYAHSVEVWRDGQLVGGLYGIALGSVFFGESMFSRASDVSKIALVWLSRQLHAWGYQLLDCQVGSPHLESLGACYLEQQEFQACLVRYIPKVLDTPSRWHFELSVPDDTAHRNPVPHS